MDNRVIKDGKIITNEWNKYFDETEDIFSEGKIILPLKIWNQNIEKLTNREKLPGLLLDTSDDPDTFQGDFSQLPLIEVNFSAFTDGRGFSIGNLLRERYEFKGELRASGHFIRDQIFYLKRCGFNAFHLEAGNNLEDALKSLGDFSTGYQKSSNQPSPLFRLRNKAV